jgi:hypothetical protein
VPKKRGDMRTLTCTSPSTVPSPPGDLGSVMTASVTDSAVAIRALSVAAVCVVFANLVVLASFLFLAHFTAGSPPLTTSVIALLVATTVFVMVVTDVASVLVIDSALVLLVVVASSFLVAQSTEGSPPMATSIVVLLPMTTSIIASLAAMMVFVIGTDSGSMPKMDLALVPLVVVISSFLVASLTARSPPMKTSGITLPVAATSVFVMVEMDPSSVPGTESASPPLVVAALVLLFFRDVVMFMASLVEIISIQEKIMIFEVVLGSHI